MAVRNALIVACLAFLAIVSSLIFFLHSQERQLRGVAANFHDRAFVGLNFIYKAHEAFVRFEDEHRADGAKSLNDAERAKLDIILDEMSVAIERAVTERSRDKAKAIRTQIAALQKGTADGSAPPDLAIIDDDLTKLVHRYVSDGLDFRAYEDDLIASQNHVVLAAIAVTLGLSFLIWLVVVKLDIAERKRAEERVRATEERFRGVFEQAAMGIGLVAPDGQFLQVNRRFADLLGYTCEEMLQLTIRDVTHPDDVAFTDISRNRLLEQKTESFSIDKRYRRKDGTSIWVRVTVSLVSDEERHPKYLIGMVEDITAEKELSETVKRSQARLASGQRIARFGSWDHDLRTGRVDWSDEMYRIYGVEREQFGATYEDFLAFVHPDDREAAAEAATRSIADHKPYDMQFRILRPDGQERIVHSQAETYFDDTGRPIRRSGSAQDVTERAQGEEALRRSEERLRQVVRVSGIGIFDHDQRTDIIYWSPAQREIYGWSPDEPVTLQKYFDHIYPEDREHVVAAVRRAHDPKVNIAFDIEHRIVRRDGAVRWITMRAHTFFEGEGAERRAVRTVGAALDITERKRAEEELRLQSAELESAVVQGKKSEKALARTNRALKVVSECNEALIRLTDEAELLREICRIIVETGRYELAWVGFAVQDEEKSVRPAAQWGLADDYLDQVKVGWADDERGHGPVGEAIRTGRPQFIRNVAADPTFAPWRKAALAHNYISVISLPLADASHVFGALSIYASELSAFDDEEMRLLTALVDNLAYGIMAIRTRVERKRSEEQLRKLSLAVEQSSNIIVITDTAGIIEYVNPRFTEVTGYSAEEAIGRTPALFNSRLTSDQKYAEFWGALTSSGEWHGEFLNRKKNGELFWCEEDIAPIHDSSGKITHFVAVETDITERRKTAEQLEQAQKMETAGRLAGGIAHDFNNLLTIIQGNLELLHERLAGQSDGRGLADRALHAAGRSAELVSQLLLFSRQQFLKPQAVDVSALIGRMKDLLGSMITETISVGISVPNRLWHAFADPAQLENALLNLAINARDAMPQGGTLSIEAENIELTPDRLTATSGVAPGSFVRIRVADTGTGMPPEVLQRAFEPFFTTKDVGKGSGLGLSMVYGFVKQSGGHIEIDSAPGRGTRVDLYLKKTEPEPVAEAPKGEVRTRAGGETILVVEDNAEVREIAVSFLQELGYRVIEAANGRAALAILKSNPAVDLLFTDIVMPGAMSGVDLARRATKLRPGIRHLFVTGYAEEAAPGGKAQAMAGEILAKPYRKDDLARAVRDALKTPAYH